MQIHVKGDVFWVESDFTEKDTLKSAGFRWHGGNCFKKCPACAAGIELKVWWTQYEDVAARLIEHADDETKQRLAKFVTTLESSHAEAADIKIPVPEGLDYFPFQKAGIAYALGRDKTLIGDEMGLGKTIQAIGLANVVRAQNILVVCPASLRINWHREMKKWLVKESQNLGLYYIVENNNPVPATVKKVIINYARLLKPSVYNSIAGREWDLVIIDEIHYCKNKKSKRARLVFGYKGKKYDDQPGLLHKAKHVVGLTGTPLLNRPLEIQPLAAAFRPDLFGNFFVFAKRYCGAVRDRWGWDFSGATNLGELQERLRGSIMVRRLKKEVMKELPDKIRQIIEIPANECAELVQAEADSFAQHEQMLEDLQDDVELARAAGHGTDYKAAVARLQEAYRVAFTELSLRRHELALEKVPFVVDHITETLDSNEDGKVVIFCHHKDVVREIHSRLFPHSVAVTGDDAFSTRQIQIDLFQDDPVTRVFVGTIGAAGVGITLTAASHVVFAELDWVPANMSQAEDRCHRIGQEADSVLIQHIVINGSLDARMAQMLVAKQAVLDQALDDEVKHQPLLPTSKPRPQRPSDFKASPAEISWAVDGLRKLAGSCDGAASVDDIGFNKLDARIGHELARVSFNRDLTNGEAWVALRILKKYHRQIGTIENAVSCGDEQVR